MFGMICQESEEFLDKDRKYDFDKSSFGWTLKLITKFS